MELKFRAQGSTSCVGAMLMVVVDPVESSEGCTRGCNLRASTFMGALTLNF